MESAIWANDRTQILRLWPNSDWSLCLAKKLLMIAQIVDCQIVWKKKDCLARFCLVAANCKLLLDPCLAVEWRKRKTRFWEDKWWRCRVDRSEVGVGTMWVGSMALNRGATMLPWGALRLTETKTRPLQRLTHCFRLLISRKLEKKYIFMGAVFLDQKQRPRPYFSPISASWHLSRNSSSVLYLLDHQQRIPSHMPNFSL